ncbi:MAG TPA: CBS domain-containing protein [Acholeplasmataceae bacterium]|nr:CBS domain-containing protein [Acholeplasmataceae bacterium]
MNILFIMIPKEKVAFIYENYTIRQTLEKMEFHRYSSIPIIDKDGKYVGTISEGDLLWYIKNHQELDFKKAEEIPITEVPRKHDNYGIYIDTKIDDLIIASTQQNFIPVLDDRDTFIGIVTRKDIIQYLLKKIDQNFLNDT